MISTLPAQTMSIEDISIAAPANPYTGWNFRFRLMGSLAIPIFLETLDYTVVATAQPHIAVSLRPSGL